MGFLEGIGCLTLCGIAVRGLRRFFPYVVRKPLANLQRVYNPKNDGFALVTGATDGIGKAFAMELARNHVNLILLGRNSEKLRLVSEEIKLAIEDQTQSSRESERVSVQTLLQDLSCPIEELASEQFSIKLKAALDSSQIPGAYVSVLINNAGVTCVSAIEDMSVGEIQSIIGTNVNAPVLLTQSFVKRIVAEQNANKKNEIEKEETKQESKHSKQFAVLNVGSITGEFAPAYLSLYAGSKAFLAAFGKSLHAELPKNVSVTTMSPYYVSTRMTRFQKLGFTTISQDEFVRSALNAMLLRVEWSAGSWKHELNYILLHMMPQKIRDHYFKKSMESPLKIRKLLLQKSRRKESSTKQESSKK